MYCRVNASLTQATLAATCTIQEGASNCSAAHLWDVVHILRLNDGLDIVLQHALEVILQLAAAEVSQDLAPVGGGLQAARAEDCSVGGSGRSRLGLKSSGSCKEASSAHRQLVQ